MVEDKKCFNSWFDPENIYHIRAYRHLQNTGAWPKDFIPKHVFMEGNWNLLIQYKMSQLWVEYMIGKYEPPLDIDKYYKD